MEYLTIEDLEREASWWQNRSALDFRVAQDVGPENAPYWVNAARQATETAQRYLFELVERKAK